MYVRERYPIFIPCTLHSTQTIQNEFGSQYKIPRLAATKEKKLVNANLKQQQDCVSERVHELVSFQISGTQIDRVKYIYRSEDTILATPVAKHKKQNDDDEGDYRQRTVESHRSRKTN